MGANSWVSNIIFMYVSTCCCINSLTLSQASLVKIKLFISYFMIISYTLLQFCAATNDTLLKIITNLSNIVCYTFLSISNFQREMIVSLALDFKFILMRYETGFLVNALVENWIFILDFRLVFLLRLALTACLRQRF